MGEEIPGALDWMHWTWQSALGFGLLFGTLAALALLDARVPSHPRKGFLPMDTTRGDRVFLGVVIFLAVILGSLRFFPEASLWGAVAVAGAAVAVTLARG